MKKVYTERSLFSSDGVDKRAAAVAVAAVWLITVFNIVGVVIRFWLDFVADEAFLDYGWFKILKIIWKPQ